MSTGGIAVSRGARSPCPRLPLGHPDKGEEAEATGDSVSCPGVSLKVPHALPMQYQRGRAEESHDALAPERTLRRRGMDVQTLLLAVLKLSWSAASAYLGSVGVWLPRLAGMTIVLVLTLSLLHRLLLHSSARLLVRQQDEMKRELLRLRLQSPRST